MDELAPVLSYELGAIAGEAGSHVRSRLHTRRPTFKSALSHIITGYRGAPHGCSLFGSMLKAVIVRLSPCSDPYPSRPSYRASTLPGPHKEYVYENVPFPLLIPVYSVPVVLL